MSPEESRVSSPSTEHTFFAASHFATQPKLSPIWQDGAVGQKYQELTPLPWYQGINQTLISFAEISSGQRVIDLACGTASATKQIADVVGPDGQVLGIEPSREMLETAKLTCQDLPQVIFRQGLAEDLGTILAGSNFRPERILAFNAIHLVSNLWKVFLATSVQLREGDIFAASTAFSDRAVPTRDEFRKIKSVMDQITVTGKKEYPAEMTGFKKRSSAKIVTIASLQEHMENALLEKIKTELVPIVITNHDLATFLSVPGVIDQILPATIPTHSRTAIIKHAIMETGITEFNRNWLLMRGSKKFF